jgi:hypothetical protein
MAKEDREGNRGGGGGGGGGESMRLGKGRRSIVLFGAVNCDEETRHYGEAEEEEGDADWRTKGRGKEKKAKKKKAKKAKETARSAGGASDGPEALREVRVADLAVGSSRWI